MAEPEDSLNLVAAPVDRDLYQDDVVLAEAVSRHGAEDAAGRLSDLGRLAGAARSQRWAQSADEQPPTMRTHDLFGRRVDELEHHPAYHRLMTTATRAGLAAAAWEATASDVAHTTRAAALVIWSQTESGHLGALCTTYAALPAISADEDLENLWLPRLASKVYDAGLRAPKDKLGCLAGLAVTERQGGPDVQTRAAGDPGGPLETGDTYRLTGLKWFVAAPMSDVFITLARTEAGVSAFLVPRVLDDGTRNTFRLQRLKNVMGQRSPGVAEVEFDDTWAVRLGAEGAGRRHLSGMTSALQLDAALRAAGMMRQAVSRTVHFARHRQATGSALVDKPLMQNVLADLAMESEAATTLAMRLAAAVDAGETDLLRAAVPVARFWIGKRVGAVVAEAVDCLGGIGVVEEHGLARVLRDCPPHALMEGSSNTTTLDVLRVMATQPRALASLVTEIDRARGADQRLDRAIDEVTAFLQAASREARRDSGPIEAGARYMVERLCLVLQASLLVQFAPPPVASTFLATRVARGGGVLFGTLPVGRRTTEALVERCLPA